MENDRTNKRLIFTPDEWRLLGRPLIKDAVQYSASYGQAPGLAQAAIEARTRVVDYDISEYPAGGRHSQAAIQRQRLLELTAHLQQGLSEFLPHDASIGDQAEAFLRQREA